MTISKTLLGFLAATLLIFSCKKEYSTEEGNIPVDIQTTWEFKEADQQYKGNTDTAFIQTIGSVKTLTIVGTQTGSQQGELILQVVGPEIEPGSYSTQYAFFQYSQNGSVVFRSLPVQGSDFTLSISEIDSFKVTGTFSGTVEDAQGNTHTIAEGKFSAALGAATDEPDPGDQTGILTVWAKQTCDDGSNIEVKVDGQTASITEAMGEQPVCSAAGTASFSLPYGIYTIEAICGTDTVRYDVTIAQQCNYVEVDFANPPPVGDYLPLGLGSFWDYNDVADPSIEHTKTAEDLTDFDSRLYTKVTSSPNGDIYYYRKDNHVYYEYRTIDYQGNVINPETLEIVILHDDYAAGDDWESPVLDIQLAAAPGIPVKMKLRSYINKRDYTSTVNGVNYPDCIEVITEIYFSSNGGATWEYGSEYFTEFSKGNGIISYYDLDRSTVWGVTNLSVVPG